MAYLGLALFAEGPTDHRFLKPVLRRLCENMCLQHAKMMVDIGDVLELHSPARVRDESRETRIREAAREARDAWHILFIHADGSGDYPGARESLVLPACRAIAGEIGEESRQTVAVIPVRETEAWCLVDGDALRRSFGTTKGNAELDVPERGRDVEGILDPKSALDEVCRRAISPRRRRGGRRKAAEFLDQIGEFVSIEQLDQVPAFGRLRQEVQDALVHLGII